MILKKIELDNIRSYEHLDFEFPKGSILLSGDIGSGKSTILQAVEFALFGLKGRELQGSTLLRHGKQEGGVKLEFYINKKPITIYRSLKRFSGGIKQDSGYIIINDIKEELMPVELKSRIINLLGYPSDSIKKTKDLIYRYTVYTPQEQMKRILFDEEERLQTLLKIFKIEKYKIIRDNIIIVKTLVRDNQKELTGQISEKEARVLEKEKIIEKINDLKSKLKEIVLEKEDLRNKKRECENKLKETEKKVELIENLKKEFKIREENINKHYEEKKSIGQRIKEIENRISELSELISNLKVIRPTELSTEEIQNRIRMLREEVFSKEKMQNALTQELKLVKERLNDAKQLKEKVKELNERIIELTNKINTREEELLKLTDIDRKSKEIEKKIHNIEKTISIRENQTKEKEKILAKITSLTKCPTCLQEVSELHKSYIRGEYGKIIIKYKNEIAELKAELLKLTSEKDLINKELKRKSNLELEVQKLKEEKKWLEEEYNKKSKSILETEELKNKVSQIEKKLESIDKEDIEHKRKEIKEYETLLNQVFKFLKKINEKNKAENELAIQIREKEDLLKKLSDIELSIQKLVKEKALLKKKIDESSPFLKVYDELKKQLAEILKEENNISRKEGEINGQLKSNQERLEDIKKEIDELNKLKKESLRLKSVENWLSGFFSPLILNIENHVLHKVYDEFNNQFMLWFNMLVEDENLSVRLDDKFTPIIIQNGYESSVENLSGGEKTAVALAYRLALNKVINDMVSGIKTRNILMLDEPTDGFSSEQLDRMRDILDSLNLEQTIIVSHEQKLEGYVDHIYRIIKNEHSSYVVYQ